MNAAMLLTDSSSFIPFSFQSIFVSIRYNCLIHYLMMLNESSLLYFLTFSLLFKKYILLIIQVTSTRTTLQSKSLF